MAQARMDALLQGIGQASEAMAKVAKQTAAQQQQLTEALQRMTATQEAQAAGAQVNGPERAPQQAFGLILEERS